MEIAKELKEIGFDEPTLFHYYENDFDVSVETIDYYNEGEAQGYLNFYISALKEEDFNIYSYYISIPTFEQVFEWFREKGFNITLENHEDSTKFMFYNMKINEGKHFKGEFSNYEEAREALVKSLIQTYKNEQL